MGQNRNPSLTLFTSSTRCTKLLSFVGTIVNSSTSCPMIPQHAGIFACQNRTDINCFAIANCAILKMRLQGEPLANTLHVPRAHHARESGECVIPRANAYHAREWVPWGRMRTRQCVPRVRMQMRTMGENAYHARMRATRANTYHVCECEPRARMRTVM